MYDRLLQHSFQISLRLPLQHSAKWRWLQCLLVVVSLMPIASGCKMPILPGQVKEVSLQMAVDSSPERSRYTVSGTTNLPDNTPITVAAIRYFYPAGSSAPGSPSGAENSPGSTFAILDYASTTVSKGKWQAELILQQQGSDGKGWEEWQMQQPKLGVTLKPAETVSFVTTLTAKDQLTPLEQQLAETGFRLPRGIVRTTTEGQRYAEISQTIALTPPNPGQQAPAASEPENYGWGDRYVLVKEPQNPTRLERPKQPQTDAPARPSEFLR